MFCLFLEGIRGTLPKKKKEYKSHKIIEIEHQRYGKEEGTKFTFWGRQRKGGAE